METTLLTSDRGRLLLISLSMIVLPFILLYWMMPFVSGMTLGADYQIFSVNEQIEMLFSIKTGSFPIYVPGYKFGHSSSALTLSQVYHPISYMASILPGYWDGKALEWNTFLRLLSLGFTQLVLFLFLRKIRLNTLFSFLVSLLTVYNLRMLEAFRYGASLEAYTGTLLLSVAAGWYFIRPTRWAGPLCVIGATYLLVCSGHPPMMFYGLLGAAVFTLISPYFFSIMLPDMECDLKIAGRFWIRILFYMGLGILLSSAYIVPFYFEFVANNIEYAQTGLQPYMGQDTVAGALNNFFMPFISDVLSTFGGSSLIIIVLFLPILRFFRVKVPSSVWAIWGVLIFVMIYILGPQTPLFRWIWEYVPFISSAGGSGRISIIMPALIMMLLAWIINAASFEVRFRDRSFVLIPYVILGLISLIMIPLYLLPVFLLKPGLGYFTPHFIRRIPFWVEAAAVFMGMASLVSLILYGLFPKMSRSLTVLLVLMVILQTGTILKYGTFVEEKVTKPGFEMIKDQKRENMDFAFRQNPGLYHAVVLNHLSRTFVEPFLGRIYTRVVPVSGQDDAYNNMERERLLEQVFVEGYSPERAKMINEGAQDMEKGTVDMVYNSFNRLQFRVDSGRAAFFGLSHPYTGHWSARVNGENVRVYRANGIANAVEIPEGVSVIEFRYWSDAFFWGMVLSFATLAVIGFFVCFRGLKGLPGIIGIIVVLGIGAGGFMLWYNSLYSGDNLDTEYTWAYTPSTETPNLAYGKKTLSHYSDESSRLRYHGVKAVDGDTTEGSGFILNPVRESLVIDLSNLREIKEIKLYSDLTTKPEILLSQDKLHWQSVPFVIPDEKRTSPLIVVLRKPQGVRFIKIIAIDSVLEIDEVEVYGNPL